MHEPGWISFYTAAHLLEKQGMGRAEACKLLRAACRDELLTTMLAPDDERAGIYPIEFWKPVAPGEWRQREVDHDSPDLTVMLNEDDFNCWRAKVAEPTKPSRTARKLELVKQALADLKLPDGVPYPEAEQRVAEWLKEKGITHIPGRSTIFRAIRAIKTMN